MVTDDERQAFSARLNEALDDFGFLAKGSGRQLALGREMGVSQKGARKWLEGESIPETTRLIDLATKFDVSFEWLATGRGDKAPPRPAAASSATQQAPNTSRAKASIGGPAHASEDYADSDRPPGLAERGVSRGDLSVLRPALLAALDIMERQVAADPNSVHQAFNQFRKELTAGMGLMAQWLGMADQFSGTYAALAAAQEAGISDFEIAPLRHIMETMSKIKRSAATDAKESRQSGIKKASLPSVQPMDETSSGSKFALSEKGQAAHRAKLPGSENPNTSHERPTGTEGKQ